LQEKLEALWEAELVDIQVEHELEKAPLTMAATVAAEKVFKSAHQAKCVKEVVEEAKQHLDAKNALYAAKFAADAATPKAKTKRSRVRARKKRHPEPYDVRPLGWGTVRDGRVIGVRSCAG
jgi:transposase